MPAPALLSAGAGVGVGTPWPGKTEPALTWEWLEANHAGLLALSGCRAGVVAGPLLRGQPDEARAMAGRLCEVFGREQVWIELQHHHLPDDRRLVRALLRVAQEVGLPVAATNDAHYATAEAGRLRDALIAVRHIQSLTEMRRAGMLPLNHAYALAGPEEMGERFAELPQALANTLAIARRCLAEPVALDFSGQRLPRFPTPPGCDEFTYLARLCHERLPRRYPRYTPAVLEQLTRELSVIRRAGLAGYFLIVWDIVRFAREQGIRCQGRGSAANSIVAYVLGITAVDPLAHNLLFERFLSDDRHTTPDIDVDFEHDRREEVIQYVYERYGRECTAMVCNVVTYRPRLAVRDLGKALGFPLAVVDRLAKSVDSYSCAEASRQLLDTLDADAPVNHPLRLLAELLAQVEGCPRHLSIHVGGMLITALPLDEVVPLERATMPGRFVCQWDKDSCEDAGLIKIDLLSLRTLGLISEALRYVPGPLSAVPLSTVPRPMSGETADGGRQTADGRRQTADGGHGTPGLGHLDTGPGTADTGQRTWDDMPLDDPALYEMLRQGDTIGTFQTESRAQVQTSRIHQATCFNDITVQIAIIRPGPIQAGAVHPYMRRRAGDEPVEYLHPCLEPVLKETLGVLLFQEQAIRVAMVAAGFTPSEADMLRRAMSRSRSYEAMHALRGRFVQGAARNGIDEQTAGAIFQQLEGFAGFGFCKSHAASFALITYQTLYLKRYHPAAFYCALLNHQPMGFYSPEVVVGDARRHGVRLLPPDVNRSAWAYTLEGPSALRMGLRAVTGVGEAAWARIEAARAGEPFAGLEDFCRRTRLPRALTGDLIRAGAFDASGKRRPLLWQLGAIDYRPEELPLEFAAEAVDLPALDEFTHTAWEYELLGLSPHGHFMRHYRGALLRVGALASVQAKERPDGRAVRVGGMVAVMQSPPTAKGVVFISLEDEFGMIDLIIKPEVFEAYRSLLRHQTLILVDGTVQRAGDAMSVLVKRALPFPQA